MIEEKFLKLIDRVFWATLCLSFLAFLASRAHGDPGYLNTMRIEMGNTPQTHITTVNNGSTVTIVPSSLVRPDETCFNNSGFTIYIGSSQPQASLIVMGFPILSSATFKFGAFTASSNTITGASGVSATCNNISSGSVVCWDGINY